MSNSQRLSELYNNFLAPEAVIWIENVKLSQKDFFFTNLEIDKALDAADTCTFSIPDAIDLEFNAKEKLFELGDNVEVHIGYADSHKDKTELSILFKGIITNVNWSFSENNYLTISIEAKDYSFLMMKHKYEKSMTDIKDSDVLNRIVSEIYSNLFPQSNRKIETTSIEYKKVQNDKENDYLFIKSLAERNGYEFFTNNDFLYFRPIPKTISGELTLRYGEEILGFKPELNIEKEVSKVQVIGLELSSDKKPIVGIAERKDGAFDDTKEGIKRLLKKLNTVEHKVKEAVKSEEEAKKRAEYLLENYTNNSFKAELTTIGIPDLIPGIAVTLDGLGKKFSNDYYIEKAVHSFSEQGYETVVNLASKKGIIVLDKKSTLTTAIVTNNKDPENLGRVKIKYPWSLDSEESYWARISTPMAGNEMGVYFIPEVDDEVLVAFIDGNIEYPIVIGSLWNQSDIPPENNSDGKNNIRKVKSRSGHEITLDDNDESNSKLEIKSASGHKILLDDSSGSENILIEDNSGSSIKLESSSNKMTIKSNMEISIEATNISLNASGELVLKRFINKDKLMGMPAARVGDSTSHGTPLSPGPGSTNVLIGGKPAWRAGADTHSCPLVNPGGAPHAVGVVVAGSTSVLINGSPAARLNDQLVESGPPNSILSGETTVLIG